MKKNLYLFMFLLSFFQLRAAETSVTTTDFVSQFNNALDGDVLLLASGEYTSDIDFPSGKTVTIKAADQGNAIIKFRISTNNADVTDGGIIFDGVKVVLDNDYFINISIGNIATLQFLNCDISKIGRCLLRTSNGSGFVIDEIVYDNCIISNCGNNGWNFMYPTHIVKRLSVTRCTLHDYTNGESFFYANGTDTSNEFTCLFQNNTVYKWAKSSDRALCNTGSRYAASSTYTFNNNIVTVPGVEGVSPQIVSTNAGVVTANNNLIVDYGAYGSPVNDQSINDHTLASLGLSAIGFPDADHGDFSILSSSPLATASTTGGPIGDPRWVLTFNDAKVLTTAVMPDVAGSVTPPLGNYNNGDEVILTATGNFGYKFVKWVDANGTERSTDNPYTFIITEDILVKAVFEPLTTYRLDVLIEGSNWGQVSLNPQPTNGLYESGTVVTATVIENRVSTFSFWDDATSDASKQIKMDGNKTLTAIFDEIPFIVGWDFEVKEPRYTRPGDYYSVSSNQGVFSMYKPDGSTVSWLHSDGAFSPSYACARMWTAAADFDTERRYFQADFSTLGYKNIKVNSMMCGNYQVYSVVKMLYSTDGIIFTEAGSVDITDNYNATWADFNVTLPSACNNQSRVYIRWVGDENSAKLGGEDNDGTAIANIFVYADEIIVNDTKAPELISTNPVSQSSTASASGNIVLTFNEKVKVGTGEISFNGEVVTPVFGSKTATFEYSGLAYNTAYRFEVAKGALTDISGNAFSGVAIEFTTMNKPQPFAKVYDLVVAMDDSGDFTSLADAIAAAPSNSTTPFLIFIKNGSYTGHIEIPSNKPFIHLIGQSRDEVIVSDNRLCGDKGDGSPVYHVSKGATVVVNSSDCYFENITFENSYGYNAQAGPQALAMYTNSDRIILKNCWLRSYQDTYLTSTNGVADRHYLENCRIEGAVDYIYGSGDVFFEECNLYNVRPTGGYIVAPNHPKGTAWGYVFNNCVLDGPEGVITYLGRPWHESPKTVFLNAVAKVGIYPVGWVNMGAIPAIFADYGTVDADGKPLDLSQRKSEFSYNKNGTIVSGTAKNSLTDNEASLYTIDNVLSGSDNWNPKAYTEAIEAPAHFSASAGFNLGWDLNNYAICYVIIRNGVVIDFTKENAYTDLNATMGVNYTYVIRAVNEFGGLSPLSTELKTNGSEVFTGVERGTEQKIVLSPNPVKDKLKVEATAQVDYVKVYNVQGLLMQRADNQCVVDVSYPAGIYIVEVKLEGVSKCLVQKIVKR